MEDFSGKYILFVALILYYLFSILAFSTLKLATGQSSSENVFFLSFSSLDSAINSPTDVEVKSEED